MKKNLILVLILGFSLYITYLLKVKHVSIKENKGNDFLISLDVINEKSLKDICFKATDFCLVNKNNEFYVQSKEMEFLADKQAILEFLSRFEYLKVDRSFDFKEESHKAFFSQENLQIIFKNKGNLEWTHFLGSLTITNDGFFYNVIHKGKNNFYVLKDVWSNQKMYANEEELNLVAYNNLKEIFLKTPNDFYHLFFFPKGEIVNLKVQSGLNIPYEISFKLGFSITPSPPQKSTYNSEIMNFEKKLHMHKAYKVHFLKDFSWESPFMSSLKVDYMENDKVLTKEYVLMKTWNGKYGYYVWPVGEKVLYEIDSSMAQIFTRPASDYWKEDNHGNT